MVAKTFPAHLIIQNRLSYPKDLRPKVQPGYAQSNGENKRLRIVDMVLHHGGQTSSGAPEPLPALGDLIVAEAVACLWLSETPLTEFVGIAPVLGQGELLKLGAGLRIYPG